MSETPPLPPAPAPDHPPFRSSTETSQIFNAGSGGDIIFRSSDNVLFYIHQKYLEAHAEGFPLAEHTAPSKINEHVPLTEQSNVLELLFQFVYPRMPPDLENLEFPLLMSLAEAAEKYIVHHARKFCVMRMRAFTSEFPLEVIAFAADHGHDQLLYEIAPRLAFKPLSEMAYILPSSLYVPWSLYHDQCTQTIWKHAIEHFQKSSSLSCPQNSTHTQTWQRHLNELKLKISNDVSILSDLDKVFSQMHPLYQDSCCNAFLKWKDQLKEDFDRQMKNLEYFRELHRAKIGGQAFRPSWGR